MDYAEATLVALAEELDTRHVLTTDEVYRIGGRKRFEILGPERQRTRTTVPRS